jgi:AraC-like DNA-binding protein
MDDLKTVDRILQEYILLNLTVENPSWPHEVNRSLTFLNLHLFKVTFSIENMRKHCNIPQKNFSTRFKRYVGKVPSSYVVYHRMEAAKLLLENSVLNLTIGDIGWVVGYEKPSSFTTIFTNKVGVSPLKWKLRYLKS